MKKLVLACALCLGAWAYEAALLKEQLSASAEQIKQILSSKSEKKSEQLYELLSPHLDRALIVHLVLGKYKKDAPAEFSELFFNYLKKDLAEKIDLLDANVLEISSVSTDEKRCAASANVSYEDAKKQINFAFRRVGDECRLYDILMMDTSFIASYRAQFADVIAKDGMSALVSKLK